MAQVTVTVDAPLAPGIYDEFFDPVAQYITDTGADGVKVANKVAETFNVKDYGLLTAGTVVRTTIMAAMDAAKVAGGGIVHFPKGTYSPSKYCHVNAGHNIKFTADSEATLVYPSSDPAVVTDATATLLQQARSFFFLVNCNNVSFEGLHFEGDSLEDDVTINLGSGVATQGCTGIRLRDCNNDYGASLYMGTSTDTKVAIAGCRSYGARGNITTGSEVTIMGNHFELPTDVGYDKVGSLGSSHAIYLTAGRNDVTIVGNTFKHIRSSGVKISGSAVAARDYIVTNNKFIDCGNAVLFGADDIQEHSNAIINNNTLVDCGTNRDGYYSVGIDVYGCTSLTIDNNKFFYTRNSIKSVTSVMGILARRYSTTSSPVEQLSITNNTFKGLDGTTPASITTHGINVSFVGRGTTRHGSVVLSGNVFDSSSGAAMTLTENIGLVVESNTIKNVTTAVDALGNRLPIYRNNVLIPGPNSSSNAQLRILDSFPLVEGNTSMSRTTGGFAGFSVGLGSGTVVDHPLLGSRGRVTPAAGRAEVVFSYGAGWTDGDTVDVASTIFTYKATAPGGGEFNSAATLIALIEAMTDITAADYGAPWSLTTNHIKVRRSAAGMAGFHVATTCANKTAGVLLPNGTGGSLMNCNARGDDTAPGSKTVVWSPMAQFSSIVTLSPSNDSAATQLNAHTPYQVSRVSTDSGSVAVLEHGDLIAGDEDFRFAIVT